MYLHVYACESLYAQIYGGNGIRKAINTYPKMLKVIITGYWEYEVFFS